MNFFAKLASAFLVATSVLLQMPSASVAAVERAPREKRTYNWEEFTGYYQPSVKVEGFEGLYKITIAPRVPKGYLGDYKNLLVSNASRISVGGRVTAQAEEYEFQSATLERRDSVDLSFTTEEVGGIMYRFQGKYVAVKLHEKSDYVIEGTLSKYSKGKPLSKAAITLNHIYELE